MSDIIDEMKNEFLNYYVSPGSDLVKVTSDPFNLTSKSSIFEGRVSVFSKFCSALISSLRKLANSASAKQIRVYMIAKNKYKNLKIYCSKNTNKGKLTVRGMFSPVITFVV